MSTNLLPYLGVGTYSIDPSETTVRFGIKELWHHVTGTFAVRGGMAVVSDDLTACRVTATLDAASFTTDKPRRDKDVRSKRFMDAETFPELTYSGSGVVRNGHGWCLPGTLTAHGRSAPVELVVDSVVAEDGGARMHATAKVDRYALGVRAGRGLIGRWLDVEIEVCLVSV